MKKKKKKMKKKKKNKTKKGKKDTEKEEGGAQKERKTAMTIRATSVTLAGERVADRRRNSSRNNRIWAHSNDSERDIKLPQLHEEEEIIAENNHSSENDNTNNYNNNDDDDDINKPQGTTTTAVKKNQTTIFSPPASPQDEKERESKHHDNSRGGRKKKASISVDPLGGEDPENLRVRLSFSVGFLLLAAVGLNGEQILDEALSLRIRVQLLEGKSSQAIGKHIAVLLTCILAWFSEKVVAKKRRRGYIVFILIWGLTQCVRLYALGVGVNKTRAVWIVVGMVMLDKYTASLGESALEYALFIWCRMGDTRRVGSNSSYARSGSVRNSAAALDADEATSMQQSPRLCCICAETNEGEAAKRKNPGIFGALCGSAKGDKREGGDAGTGSSGIAVSILFALYFILERVTKIMCQRLLASKYVSAGVIETLVLVLTITETAAIAWILRDSEAYHSSRSSGTDTATDTD